MKKAAVVLVIFLVCLIQVSTVYAGTLNAYENEVIAEAQKVYELKGVKYKTAPAYINQLRDYFAADGMDLTAEQRDEVLQAAYSSIEKGVEEGYLLPVEGQSTQEDSTADTAGASDTVTDQTPASTEVTTGTQEITPQAEETATANNDVSTNSNNDNNSNDDNNSKDENNSKDINNNASNQSNLSDSTGQIEKATPVEIIDQVLSKDGNLNTTNNIIKNTGFDFSDTILTIAGLGILMLLGIIISVKQNLFAHKDE